MAGKRARDPAVWTRDGVKRHLVRRFYTRFHMSLILASSGLAAMLASWALLQIGVGAMLVRYPIAVLVAYLTFLLGVWLWLKYVGIGDDKATGRSLVENADLLPDIGGGSGSGSSGGGILPARGGSFDGGGASASWAEGGRAPVVASNVQTRALAAASASDSGSAGAGSSDGGAGLGDLGGDELALLVLAVALLASIAIASGYIVWMAPDILTEAAFGALLAGGLARPSRREDAADWISGVARKTWWPFAVVLVVATAFAWYAAAHYPAARTFKDAVSMALAS